MTQQQIIEHLGCDEKEAALVLGLIRGEIDPDNGELFPKTKAWIHSSYNRPNRHALRMSALNEVLGGSGVEAELGDSLTEAIIEWINTGDTYSPTITFRGGKYRLETMGDAVEAAGL
jgi:hypothetical protein